MTFKTSLCLVILMALSAGSVWAAEEGDLSLSLEDCILKALENNLRVAVEVINPGLAEMSVTRAKEIFMPRFDLNLGARNTESPSFWFLEASDTSITKSSDYSVAVVKRISTGGNLSLSLTGYKSDTNQTFQLINPRYGSTLQLDFSQPLLRDFGYKVNRREILIAQNNLDISQRQFEFVLMETIYSVQDAYWNLVYAIENYNVTEQSLQLAQDLLAKNKKEVEVGKLAEIEILNAEAVVASREADVLQAEALIRKSEDALRNILNLLEVEEIEPKKIIPLDRPSFEKQSISLSGAIRTALSNRPDLTVSRRTIKTKELNLSGAKNQLLPGLDLQFSYWSPGLSGDRLLYLDNNPFLGVVIGTEEKSAWNSLWDSIKLKHSNWSINLTLSVPISNFLTKANFITAQMELEQSFLELQNREKQVLLDVRNVVRDIESLAKRYAALKIASRHALKRLEAEEKKLSVGLSTNYFVLQYQEELANTRSQEIKTLVDYNLALARMENVLGTSLAMRNIKIEQFY